MKIKTSELIEEALDWAVGVVEGLGDIAPEVLVMSYMPSNNWATCGPLIEKYRISFVTIGTGPEDEQGNEPIVALTSGLHYKACQGKTHLVAACRAIVAARLGDEVDVPEMGS